MKSDEEKIKEPMKQMEANDAGATYVLGSNQCHGQFGLYR
jgi:hypothetical protein